MNLQVGDFITVSTFPNFLIFILININSWNHALVKFRTGPPKHSNLFFLLLLFLSNFLHNLILRGEYLSSNYFVITTTLGGIGVFFVCFLIPTLHMKVLRLNKVKLLMSGNLKRASWVLVVKAGWKQVTMQGSRSRRIQAKERNWGELCYIWWCSYLPALCISRSFNKPMIIPHILTGNLLFSVLFILCENVTECRCYN